MGYAGNGMRVAPVTILLVVGLAAQVAGARPLLEGTKRADRLSGGGAAETIKGGKGDDRLSGGGGNDLLLGGPGRDRLTGGSGLDDLRGEAGNDLLDARDGKADRLDCGPGKDRAVADVIDVTRRCEHVDVKRPAGAVQAPPAGLALPPTTPAPAAPPEEPLIDFSKESELIAAGDIADCTPEAEETAKLLDRLPGAVAVLGDAVYEAGSREEYSTCYAPTWGRHKRRTHAVVGDHDYKTPGAAGFFAYFGAAGGEPGKGWYSYDLGTWHVVALNSACDEIGGCGPGSPQEQWLREDLAASAATCRLAYWHTPRFSSGEHGSTAAVAPLWQALDDYGAELVLSGNDHDYERFAPQNAVGDLDLEKGLRQFVVGTGGRYLRALDAAPQPNSEVRDAATFGVLDLKLNPSGYDWEFVPVDGSSFTDSGAANCR